MSSQCHKHTMANFDSFHLSQPSWQLEIWCSAPRVFLSLRLSAVSSLAPQKVSACVNWHKMMSNAFVTDMYQR